MAKRMKVTLEEARKINALGLETVIRNNKDYNDLIISIFKDYNPQEMVNISEHNGDKYAEHCEVWVQHKGTWLKPIKQTWNKKMFLFTLAEIPYNYVELYNNPNPRPNYVGKPTDKKMSDWVDYLIQELEDKERILDQHRENRKNSLKKLEVFGNEINWNHDKTGGYVERNGLEYQFKINKNGTLSEKILISSMEQTLEKFFEISK